MPPLPQPGRRKPKQTKAKNSFLIMQIMLLFKDNHYFYVFKLKT